MILIFFLRVHSLWLLPLEV